MSEVVTNTAKPSTTMGEKIFATVGDLLIASAEATAQLSLGQGLLRVADRFLWVVEKSAQWSLPVHEINADENGKTFGKIELVRPLPWVFFLPGLVMLRACRLGINVGAVILGYPQLQPTALIKFIQKGRRRLRSIKYNGLKNMRHRKGTRNKQEELSEAKQSLIKSMLSGLSALSCLEASRRPPSPTPTRVYVQRSGADTTPTPDEHSTTESTSPQVDPKRKYCEVTGPDESSDQSEEESTDAKLERLAAEDSDEDDEDFNPAVAELIALEASMVDEDDEDSLSDNELSDLQRAVHLNGTTGVDEVIVEEPEPEPESELQGKQQKEPEVVDKGSMPINTSEAKPLDVSKPTEAIQDNILLYELHAPATPEASTNYYSPISSPIDSIENFKSPLAIEVKESDMLKEKINGTSVDKSVISAAESESHQDNGELDSSGASNISGTSPEGAANGTSHEKRNSTTGKPHHKGKHVGFSQRKKK